jgi:hypothetical protein
MSAATRTAAAVLDLSMGEILTQEVAGKVCGNLSGSAKSLVTALRE